MSYNWPTKRLRVASLILDSKNPRLGEETPARSPRDIIQHLFEHDKAMDVAESIATRGYFPNEPLLAVKAADKTVVVEGNRRLAALKALLEPALLDAAMGKQVERLARRISDIKEISTVPVTLAPSRRATDRQIAGRHVGTPVLAWQAEHRASFILEKLSEGYDNTALQSHLGFSLADIQKARQLRAIADIARSIALPDEVKSRLESPRVKLFSTIERVIDSTIGRKFLKVEPNTDHGLRGTTTKEEFLRGFSKLVTDVAMGRQSSRTLNTSDHIREYFESWDRKDLPQQRQGSFVPSDITAGESTSPARQPSPAPPTRRSRQISKTVLPRDFRVLFGSDRLIDIRSELTKLRREDFPNAGAVLLRVFFELTVVDYLQRTGELSALIQRLKAKGTKLKYDIPEMRQLVPEVIRIAKAKLKRGDATKVEKAVRYDEGAPFTLSDLHAFVHKASDVPGHRDIWQFWVRTEPLFRLMLEQHPGADHNEDE